MGGDRRPVRPGGPGNGLIRTPATWVLAATLLAGAALTASMLWQPLLAYPRATLLAVVLFGLYAVPFLAFISNVDYLEREPVVLLAAAFAWGGLVATATATPANAALDAILAKTVSPGFAARWGAAVEGPTIEEPIKFLGVIMIALVASGQINSLVDGLVYGAVVGLGFQVVEDVGYALRAVADEGTGDQVTPVMTTFFTRGFVSGLWSHTVFTALAGAGVAYVLLRRERSLRNRLTVGALALAGAWLCHFFWNLPILTEGLNVPVELLVKGVPPLVLVLALTRNAGNDEARFYADRLQQWHDVRVASPPELLILGSAAGRAAARRSAQERGGRRAARAVHRLQRAQARLAVELSRGNDQPTPAVCRAYVEVLAARHRLMAVGLDRYGQPPARQTSGA